MLSKKTVEHVEGIFNDVHHVDEKTGKYCRPKLSSHVRLTNMHFTVINK